MRMVLLLLSVLGEDLCVQLSEDILNRMRKSNEANVSKYTYIHIEWHIFK